MRVIRYGLTRRNDGNWRKDTTQKGTLDIGRNCNLLTYSCALPVELFKTGNCPLFWGNRGVWRYCLFGEFADFDEVVEAGVVFCCEELDFYCGR